MTSNLCLLNVDLNGNEEDVQSIFAGPCYVLNIFNICYTKHFHLLTLKVRFSETSLLLVLKVKKYFAVGGRLRGGMNIKRSPFPYAKTRKINASFLKWIRETTDKAKVTPSTNELSLPCKTWPS